MPVLSGRALRCPNCGRSFDPAQAADLPFCSERCRLLDLGAWLTDGARSIAGERAVPPDTADESDLG